MESKTVVYERQDQIGIIQLNRPEAGNAINRAMAQDLLAALEAARDDGKAKVIIAKAKGKSFCTGMDLNEAVLTMTFEQNMSFDEMMQNCARTIRYLGKPIIASVQGYCIGAGSCFAITCDMRIAAEDARFSIPEAVRGSHALWGLTQTLPRLVGVGRAKQLLLTGEMLGAEEAEKWGLVNKVVPLSELDSATMEIANKIAASSSLGVTLTRLLIDRHMDISYEAALDYETYSHSIPVLTGERQKQMSDMLRKIRHQK